MDEAVAKWGSPRRTVLLDADPDGTLTPVVAQGAGASGVSKSALEAVKAATDAEPQHGFTVTVPPGWAKAWPQSAHLLREEVVAWQRTPWGLKVHGLDD